MTERLYYDASYMDEFIAYVTAVREKDGKTEVALNRSAFYPTSGGQPYDTGVIGEAKVLDVNVDNAGATSKIVHYLHENGHTRIGLLCVPHQFHYITDRHAGYLRGMEECGLEPDPRWTSCSDDIEHSLEAMLALPVKKRPTALVALSDSVAAKVQAYAVRNGLVFPRDISVVGFGDSDIAGQLPFPLTTMRESLQKTGQLLVRLLMKEPMGMEPDAFNVFHTHAVLVERESVFNITNQNRRSK